jgi:hypothetical protein
VIGRLRTSTASGIPGNRPRLTGHSRLRRLKVVVLGRRTPGSQAQAEVGDPGLAGVLVEQHHLGDVGPGDPQRAVVHAGLADPRVAQRHTLAVGAERQAATRHHVQEPDAADAEQQQPEHLEHPDPEAVRRQPGKQDGERGRAGHHEPGAAVEAEALGVAVGR